MANREVIASGDVPPHIRAYYTAEAAIELLDSGKKSAELTLAKRKLQEGMSWIEWHMRENEQPAEPAGIPNET